MSDATEITNIVFSALSDRKGFDQWFDQIDDELQAEIKTEIAEAIAALRAQPAGWRPIESAPKDGTLLLLWESYEDEPFIGRWHDFRSRWIASTAHYNTDGDACVIDTVCSEGVTHWMPLPPPPAIGETME